MLSRDFEKSLKAISAAVNAEKNDDLIIRRFTALSQPSALIFVDGMVSAQLLGQMVLEPLTTSKHMLSGMALQKQVVEGVLCAVEVSTESDFDKAVESIMQGQCVLIMDTMRDAIIIDARAYVHRGVSAPRTEAVVVGPHEAFTETLRDNLTLMHRILQTPRLAVKQVLVGTEIPTQLAICYLDGVARADTVARLEKRLTECRAPYLLPGGMLEQLIEDSPYAPLPQAVSTERPDRAASFLLEGQVVLLCDGAPQALAMPIGLFHLFHAPDDTAMRWQYGTAMRLVRFFGAMLALVLPALFVALCRFHPGTLPMSMLTSILESESNLPLGIFLECVIMLVLFGLINEAGMRVPGLLGSTLGLVSALILGSAAVEAELVSPMLIIVVALGGLGSYAIPDYSVGLAFRALQLLLVVLAGFFGALGLLGGLAILLCWVAGMQSLGAPYLAPLSPSRMHNPDLILRAPIYRQRLLGYMGNPKGMTWLRGRMRGFKR